VTGAVASYVLKYNELLSLSGTGLSPSSGNTQLVLTGGGTMTATNTATTTATAITANIPDVPNGIYMVNIYVPGKGYAKFVGLSNNPLIQNSLLITGVSPLSGSIGGNLLTVSGSGFDSMTEIVVRKVGSYNYQKCERISRTGIQIECFFPIFSSQDAAVGDVLILQNGVI